jgi:uncharacterized phage-associated protein
VTEVYDPRCIANLMLDESERVGQPLTNLALQKLLYFAHAIFSIEQGRPLVSGYFEPWEYGPVHPAAYRSFKSAGVQNVGNETEDFPVRIGLPNPLIDEVKPFCRVLRVVVKAGGQEEIVDLSEPERKFRESIKNDRLSTVPFEAKVIKIKPEEQAEIIFDYTTAKEEEDNEIFQTKLPTDSIVMTITDKGPTKRIIRAKTLHMAPFEDDTSADQSGTYNFSLFRYLLPHQGFVIWWKKVPPKPK